MWARRPWPRRCSGRQTGDDGAGRRAAGNRDRHRRRLAGAERSLRERDALPRPRLRRHSLRLRQSRLDGDRPGSPRSRLGMAASGAFHARGFHPTAICGVFGATAAATRIAGLDAPRTASALGIAGSMASGLFAYLEEGTPTKPIHPAWAAHGGLIAARLSALGAEGPTSVVEGKFGLYHAFLGAAKGEVDVDAQLADLGERWETPRMAYKPYPACHFMHGSLGATAEAMAGFSADDIEEVVVTVPAAGVSLVLEPAEVKVAPRTEYEGKFSLQYSTAAMIVHGRVGISTYSDEALTDPRVLELARRVRYETKDYDTYPAAFPGGVRIRTREGR